MVPSNKPFITGSGEQVFIFLGKRAHRHTHHIEVLGGWGSESQSIKTHGLELNPFY